MTQGLWTHHAVHAKTFGDNIVEAEGGVGLGGFCDDGERVCVLGKGGGKRGRGGGWSQTRERMEHL